MQIFRQKNVTKNYKHLQKLQKCTNFAPFPDILSILTTEPGTKVLTIKNHIIMKRIEFIAPVAAMRGNLSGDQKLLYPTKNNSAWEAPQGQRSAATNYQPRYIGAKRVFNDLKTFSTRTRSSVNITPAMRKNMALLAAVNDITNKAIMNLTIYDQLGALALEYKPANWSFKHWVSSVVRQALINQAKTIIFDPKGTPTPAVNNPFTVGFDNNAEVSSINPEIFYKFFLLLGREGSAIMNISAPGRSDIQSTVVTGVTFGDLYAYTTNGIIPMTIAYSEGKQDPQFLFFRVANGTEPDRDIVIDYMSSETMATYHLKRREKGSEDAWVNVTSVMVCDIENYEYQLQPNA